MRSRISLAVIVPLNFLATRYIYRPSDGQRQAA